MQVGASMNMAIGAAAPSTAVANLLGSLAVLLSILFGGFLLSRQQMPSVVAWMAQLSFVRYFLLPLAILPPLTSYPVGIIILNIAW